MFELFWKTEYKFPQAVQVLQQMQPAVFRTAVAHYPRTLKVPGAGGSEVRRQEA